MSPSKTTPPRLFRIVHRPRLIDCLESHKEKKLTLILAQAAQGKSTLAASYVETSKLPSAWMNLDPEDSDPANLFHLLIHAFQNTSAGFELFDLLDYPGRTAGPRAGWSLYTEWLQAVFERIQVPIQLVLDGLDRLNPEASRDDGESTIGTLLLRERVHEPCLGLSRKAVELVEAAGEGRDEHRPPVGQQPRLGRPQVLRSQSAGFQNKRVAQGEIR